MHILITGASGFVGQALTAFLTNSGHTVTPLQRNSAASQLTASDYDCLIHLAARAHVLRDTAQDAYQAFKAANVDYSLKMAQLARQLQIPRFIFLSSIGVNGQCSQQPFTENDIPQPHNDYAQTKWEAEQALTTFFRATGTALTIIRPPLVYGPHAKANFSLLLSLCRHPLPLPFGAIHNQRSLIGIHNLCQFIELCCRHPAAANQTFLISDDQDVSTRELVTSIKQALHRAPMLIPVPQSALSIILRLLGKQQLHNQLLGNLQIDTSKAKAVLNWRPAMRFNEGIRQAVTIDA